MTVFFIRVVAHTIYLTILLSLSICIIVFYNSYYELKSCINVCKINPFFPLKSFRPATAKPVENVILDQGHQSEEEEETFILVENESPENLEVEVRYICIHSFIIFCYDFSHCSSVGNSCREELVLFFIIFILINECNFNCCNRFHIVYLSK